LTAKTGHYWTQPAQMRSLVVSLTGIPDEAFIRPNFSDDNTYRCGEYRKLGNKASPIACIRQADGSTGEVATYKNLPAS
jgi:hypothetical protein